MQDLLLLMAQYHRVHVLWIPYEKTIHVITQPQPQCQSLHGNHEAVINLYHGIQHHPAGSRDGYLQPRGDSCKCQHGGTGSSSSSSRVHAVGSNWLVDHFAQAETYTKKDPYTYSYHKITTLGEFIDMVDDEDIIGNNLKSPGIWTKTPQFIK